MKYQHDTIEYIRVPYPTHNVLANIQATVVTLAAWACTGGTFQSENASPLTWGPYVAITWDLYAASLREHWAQPFSGCAYLWHWCLECAGLGFVHGIGRTGKPDNPLTRLAYHPLSEPVLRDTVLEAGDIVQIGEGKSAHVFGALASNAGARGEPCSIASANYGQEGATGNFCGSVVPVGGIVRTTTLTLTRRGQLHGKRQAHRVLRLRKLIEAQGAGSELAIPRDCLDFWTRLCSGGANAVEALALPVC